MCLNMTGCTAMALLLLMCASCARTERTEAVTAEITAAQMEGRNAARQFLQGDWSTGGKLYERLDSVKALRDSVTECDPKRSEAFDTAFIRTVRTVRPELEHRILKMKD